MSSHHLICKLGGFQPIIIQFTDIVHYGLSFLGGALVNSLFNPLFPQGKILARTYQHFRQNCTLWYTLCITPSAFFAALPQKTYSPVHVINPLLFLLILALYTRT